MYLFKKKKKKGVVISAFVVYTLVRYRYALVNLCFYLFRDRCKILQYCAMIESVQFSQYHFGLCIKCYSVDKNHAQNISTVYTCLGFLPVVVIVFVVVILFFLPFFYFILFNCLFISTLVSFVPAVSDCRIKFKKKLVHHYRDSSSKMFFYPRQNRAISRNHTRIIT